jgi:bacterioferritin
MAKKDNIKQRQQQIIAGLKKGYWMELETVMNYIANSINLDGILAEEIKKSLAADVTAEMGHAQQLGNRIKVLGGSVPGSADFKPGQKQLQPPAKSTDVISVIHGVLAAEKAAIEHYNMTIKLCEGIDYVTQDTLIQLLGDEESHYREFKGFLTEFQHRGK